MTTYIFFTGGVLSSLGKGLTCASLAAVLKARGYTVRIRKLDPYLNVDPGTMNPLEHGEVYVTEDGYETDLDLGHYERFTNVASRGTDSVSSGRIFEQVLRKEREGKFLGRTIQIVPHITNEIQDFLRIGDGEVDFMICEIGGTVGDIEGMPFYEAIRQFSMADDGRKSVFVHLTYVPYMRSSGEHKTKPTQHSVHALRGIGITPDVIICRSEEGIREAERKKVALFCSLKPERVISIPDLDSIYKLPLVCHEEKLDIAVLKAAGIENPKEADLSAWVELNNHIRNAEGQVDIAVVGKYTELADAYKSVGEALRHGGFANNVKVNIDWVDAEDLERETSKVDLLRYHGILVPGGFGERGTRGMIEACRIAREYKIPYLGICFGMHMAILDGQRNLLQNAKAGSEEFDEGKPRPDYEHFVYHMKEWVKDGRMVTRDISDAKGGSMRLGAYESALKPGSLAHKIYGADVISERHRHRYEVNSNYLDEITESGLDMSGTSPDGELPEIFERPDHPWFLGVQYHPELKSAPLNPHPIFVSFVQAAKKLESIV